MKHKKLLIALAIVFVLVLGFLVGNGLMHSGNAPEMGEQVAQEQQTAAPSAPMPENEATPQEAVSEPSELEQTEENTQAQSPAETVCSLTVRCDKVLAKMDKLKEEKRSLVPKDGIVFSQTQISFTEGESVFDVLKREMEKNGIELTYMESAVYNSIYVQGIGGLFEFDCGSSGWTYTVNGESPLYGSSQYAVKNGDVIEFIYVC